MKQILVFFLAIVLHVNGAGPEEVQVVSITDLNGEQIAGARVELIGTGIVLYSNIKGECYVPLRLLIQSEFVRIESISYKPVQKPVTELRHKIVLQQR